MAEHFKFRDSLPLTLLQMLIYAVVLALFLIWEFQ